MEKHTHTYTQVYFKIYIILEPVHCGSGTAVAICNYGPLTRDFGEEKPCQPPLCRAPGPVKVIANNLWTTVSHERKKGLKSSSLK